MNMIYKLINCMSRPLSGHTLLYTYICLYDYEYSMDFFLFYLMVILRSTTGPYGRPMIEVTYGEILFSLYRAVWEMIAQEKWLGYRHVVAHVRHTRVNTSVGLMFSNLYVLCFQIYTYI